MFIKGCGVRGVEFCRWGMASEIEFEGFTGGGSAADTTTRGTLLNSSNEKDMHALVGYIFSSCMYSSQGNTFRARYRDLFTLFYSPEFQLRIA